MTQQAERQQDERLLKMSWRKSTRGGRVWTQPQVLTTLDQSRLTGEWAASPSPVRTGVLIQLKGDIPERPDSWAQQVVIAPATANTIARLAHGMADDLVSTLCLATEAPLLLAPAMNHRMWRHPATQANMALLAARGVGLIGPNDGPLAEGESGPGRMAEPAEIVAALGSRA